MTEKLTGSSDLGEQDSNLVDGGGERNVSYGLPQPDIET